MELFRLSRAAFATPLSGKGAALKGARWNSPGVEMIYTAANRSLAMAEVAVHLTWATLPSDYVMITIVVPDDVSIQKITPRNLPPGWNSFPYVRATQLIGDQFIAAGKHAILQVPSSVTSGDFNLLINPWHREFSRIKIQSIEPFPFDQRLFK